MKRAFFILVVLISPFFGISQSQSLTGYYTGTLTNDSVTMREELPFELALTEYKGKIYGYSRRAFVINDTLYYVMKRVKGRIEGDICEVHDDEYISYNFPTKLDKGIKVTYTFTRDRSDSIWRFSGKWTTNKVKRHFYAMSGTVTIQQEKDLSKSKIFPHLEELALAKDVPFYANTINPVTSQETPKATPTVKKEPETVPLAVAEKKTQKKTDNPPVKKETAAAKAGAADPKRDKENGTAGTKASNQQTTAANTTGEKENKPISATVAEKPKDMVLRGGGTVAAASFEKRKLETIQTIEFKTDSLVLTLYDNGEIDGDTVSVLLNNEIILAKQGLKSSAIRKTIYITPALQDSFALALYAENLGKYPPNTGLIVVRDGDDAYQVRFSADLQKNVAVIFKRKKK